MNAARRRRQASPSQTAGLERAQGEPKQAVGTLLNAFRRARSPSRCCHGRQPASGLCGATREGHRRRATSLKSPRPVQVCKKIPRRTGRWPKIRRGGVQTAKGHLKNTMWAHSRSPIVTKCTMCDFRLGPGCLVRIWPPRQTAFGDFTGFLGVLDFSTSRPAAAGRKVKKSSFRVPWQSC